MKYILLAVALVLTSLSRAQDVAPNDYSSGAFLNDPVFYVNINGDLTLYTMVGSDDYIRESATQLGVVVDQSGRPVDPANRNRSISVGGSFYNVTQDRNHGHSVDAGDVIRITPSTSLTSDFEISVFTRLKDFSIENIPAGSSIEWTAGLSRGSSSVDVIIMVKNIVTGEYNFSETSFAVSGN